MLTFIGLGLYDERSITIEGRDALRNADRVYAEFYTSELIGTTVAELESYHGVEITVRDRAGVEQRPDDILRAAGSENVVFLTAGDTMISTTHVDLRLRAHDRGIETRIIHGITAQTATSALTGLQNYRFGKATTLPFPYAHGADGLPASVTETIEDNRRDGLHTVVYLDIKVEREEYMTADVGADLLAEAYPDLVGVVVARAGSPDPLVDGGRMSDLATREFGDPLHLLVVPGECHLLEADALVELGGVDREHLDVV
ncbi:diphthine synthase [Natrarchaeobius halalkaliphilus]|uniref:Diphthine synthase n=1 Tax=Natrarchaeobius halalkaliphilus TaxID=1679091 RepID=A0A3N6LKJ8_9EURY|nr:diphthine synthase [Natrarchaeobius halalkaliphilus]RQG86968.1 diphthine synthase [Natrarchaeobius halalkaliphilus]